MKKNPAVSHAPLRWLLATQLLLALVLMGGCARCAPRSKLACSCPSAYCIQHCLATKKAHLDDWLCDLGIGVSIEASYLSPSVARHLDCACHPIWAAYPSLAQGPAWLCPPKRPTVPYEQMIDRL